MRLLIYCLATLAVAMGFVYFSSGPQPTKPFNYDLLSSADKLSFDGMPSFDKEVLKRLSHEEASILISQATISSVAATPERERRRSEFEKQIANRRIQSVDVPTRPKQVLDDRGCATVAKIALVIATWRDSGKSQRDTRNEIRDSARRNDVSESLLVGVVDHVYKHAHLSPGAIKSHWDAACLLR